MGWGARQSPGALILAALALVLAGCGAGGPALGGPGPTGISPLEEEIVGIEGQTLVVPIALEGQMPAAGRVPVQFEPGGAAEGTLLWYGTANPESGGDAANFAEVWLGRPGPWSVTRPTDSTRPADAGFWAISVRPPASAAAGKVQVGGSRAVPMRWLPVVEPAVAGSRGPSATQPSSLDQLRGSAWANRALEVEARSPLTRWRARMAARNLSGAGGAVPVAIARPFPDPLLEALALQTEGRWNYGLARLDRADAAVGAQVRWRLATLVDFGNGVAMPAWPVDGPALGPLLEDLLDPATQPAELVRRARTWLSGRPTVVAWVIDEGRPLGGPGAAGVFGAANLTWEPLLAWAAPAQAGAAGGAEGADLVPVGPLTAREVVGMAPAPRSDAQIAGVAIAKRPASELALARPAVLEVRAGEFRGDRAIPSNPAPVLPPGLRLGPLLPDWTMTAWLAAGTATAMTRAQGVPDIVPDGRWLTAAVLLKDDQAAGLIEEGLGRAPTRRTEPGWLLYVECGVGAEKSGGGPAQAGGGGAGGGGGEDLRFWFGPMGSTASVIRIRSDGSVFDETNASVSGSSRARVGRVPVRIESDRWACWVPVPPECIESDGILRMAIERTDSRGLRSAWPRPMLPWQREPGRAALLIGAWPEPAAR